MNAELTKSFLEETISPNQDRGSALTAFLAAAYARARERWPGVELPADEFAKQLGRVAPDEGDFVEAFEKIHCDDLFLAAACATGAAPALRIFEAQIMPRAAAAVARVDGSPQFIEDICGDLRIRLFVAEDKSPEVLRYLGRGPLAHWVQVVAMRLAKTPKRKKTREIAMDLPQVVDTMLADDPEIAPFADQLRQPFTKVFSEALNELSSRERNVLRLYLIDGVSAETIGKMYRVHRATVARWITRARDTVQRETRRRLVSAVSLDATSFESVVGLMWDGLDMSLATFLGSESAHADPHDE